MLPNSGEAVAEHHSAENHGAVHLLLFLAYLMLIFEK
jgi:hypothetical protein